MRYNITLMFSERFPFISCYRQIHIHHAQGSCIGILLSCLALRASEQLEVEHNSRSYYYPCYSQMHLGLKTSSGLLQDSDLKFLVRWSGSELWTRFGQRRNSLVVGYPCCRWIRNFLLHCDRLQILPGVVRHVGP